MTNGAPLRFCVHASDFTLCVVNTLCLNQCSQWRIQEWRRPRRGRRLLRQLHFENFVCRKERIWTLGGGDVH